VAEGTIAAREGLEALPYYLGVASVAHLGVSVRRQTRQRASTRILFTRPTGRAVAPVELDHPQRTIVHGNSRGQAMRRPRNVVHHRGQLVRSGADHHRRISTATSRANRLVQIGRSAIADCSIVRPTVIVMDW
jgi:hypothetical protein